MTRSYRDTRELPVWFYNLTPPDDKPHRAGYGYGEFPVRETLMGFIDVPADGTARAHHRARHGRLTSHR